MIEVLYEDNHLLALNKPKGLLTQSNETNDPNLQDLAKAWIKKRDQKSGNVFLHAVHRLDRPVSGIVLFAKSQKSLSRLNAMMREGKIKKIYRAWVEGFTNESGELVSYLAHSTKMAKATSEGKKCVLNYKRLSVKKNCSLVEVELVTGRYHQIRAQFQEFGHPIVGDLKYGSTISLPQGIHLSHVRMEFLHPVRGDLLQIQLPDSASEASF